MRSRTHRGTAVALAAASTLFLAAGCGDADGGKGSSQQGKTQAKAGLVTVKDLPGSGWTADPTAGTADPGPVDLQIGTAAKAVCQPMLDAFVGRGDGPQAKAHATADYVKGDHGPQMHNAVSLYDPSGARQILGANLDFGACKTFSGTLHSQKVDYRASQLKVPAVGEGARGVRLTAKENSSEHDTQIDIAATRVGGTVVTVVQHSHEAPDQAAFEQAFRKSVERASVMILRSSGASGVFSVFSVMR
ncbi:hypothetical protein [Streptomyces sp. URMC 123]|uniref:hypothetical protein n=1 Tax=Streptomyces sp. URMC 123 TaxID=3423403 RepID=UPI003F1D5FDC